MAYEHPSNLPGAYDRTAAHPEWSGVVFREDRFAQAAELNEVQSIVATRGRRIASLIAKDGDRVEAADIVVDVEHGRLTLAAGRVYVRGDVREVVARVIEDVALENVDVVVGVRLVRQYITEEDLPALAGLHPGTEAEGEPGAGRVVETVSWSLETAAEPGDFYAVYLVRNGTVIDQTPPPSLSGINQAIAVYDRDANGSYIVNGCRVTALGRVGQDQVFSIEEGTANIFGFKRTRFSSTRYAEPELWDTEVIPAEPHSFDDAGTGTAVIRLNRGPIAAVNSVIITREITETIVRGGTNNTSDALGREGVTQILEVKQGGTTFVQGTDYVLAANRVDWSPAGAEPTPGSSYQVTYRYLDAVVPDAVSEDTVTVSGGVTGTAVQVGYAWKLPRIDLICLDQAGAVTYLTGQPARERPVAPIEPVTLLALAEVHNDWRGAPKIVNSGVRSVPYKEMWRYLGRLFDALDLIALERLRRDIDSREPVAKKGVFVDPFTSDRYRDAGEAQDAAVFGGSMQIAIDPAFHRVEMAGPIMLDHVEEVVIEQPLATGCMKINPYQNFLPLPAKMTINPAVDFWTVSQTQWTSPATSVFGVGNVNRTTVTNVVVDQREQLAEFLRQIPVGFVIEGFGPGEILQRLAFDGVDVTPAGPVVADGEGTIVGQFMIPANITAGQKRVAATGAGGSTAEALFVGQGRIEIRVMQRVTTVELSPPIDTGPQGADQSSGEGGSGDPLAQTVMLPQARHVLGLDVKFCAVGDPANHCVLELVEVDTGLPTRRVITDRIVPMATVEVDQWRAVRFPAPAFLTGDREFAYVMKSDDADHSLAVASVGDFDPVAQKWVGGQPYSVGVLLSSANSRTWTPHQNTDLTMRVVAARFTQTVKVVELGAFDLVNCSDLIIRGSVELPTADCSFRFEVVRPSGEIIRLQPDQPYEFTSFVTETVALRAVLTGTEFVSPTLYPGVTLVAGTMRPSGTYVSRAFDMGTAIRLSSFAKTRLPAGSTLTAEVDAGDGNWQTVALQASTPLQDGWIEREYRLEPHTAQQGRLRLTLTGTPAARPSVADLRAVII